MAYMQHISRSNQLADSILYCWQASIAGIYGYYYVSFGRFCVVHDSFATALTVQASLGVPVQVSVNGEQVYAVARCQPVIMVC
jgi:hypothetical protein